MSNFDKVVDAGKAFACSIYRTQPGALIPNPISEFLRLSWDGFCGDDGASVLPPPPAPPFTGGQCPVLYEVTYQITDPRNPSRPSQTTLVYGAVASAVNDYSGTTPTFFPYKLGINAKDSSQRPMYYQLAGGNEPTQTLQRGWTIRIVSVRRTDGQPDNCGSLPATYPPSSPPPVGGYTSSPTTITYNDGSSLTVVFNLQPPSGDVTSPPDICLLVTAGNKSFKVCYPFGKTPYLPDSVDVGNLIRELQEDIRDFRESYERDKNPLPPDQDPALIPKPLGGEDGGEDEAPGLTWLEVVLTEPPQKAQFGNPTVFFAGWVTFRVNDAYTERQQISYERSLFKAPEGATGYGVTFTNFSKGNVVGYVKYQS